jgi:O-antigen ligase
MVDPIASTIIVALSALALLIFLNAIRKTIARGEWDSAALFGASSVILTKSLACLAVTYRGEWTIIANRFEFEVLTPGWARLSIQLANAMLVVVSMTIFLGGVRRNNLFPAAALFLAVTISSVAATVLHGDNPIQSYVIVLLAVLVACTVAPRGLGIHLGIATSCIVLAIASGFSLAGHADFSAFPCSRSKCGILGFMFRGIYEYENGLAMVLVLAMPFVYIAFASWEGPVLSAYLLGLTLVSGSRSATVAGVITFVMLILVRPNIRRPTWAPKRTAVLYLVLAIAFTVGLALPFYTDDPSAFTGRGYLWMLARGALSDPSTLLHGNGLRAWQRETQEAGMIFTPYSVHNQWLQILYSTGIIGFLLAVAAVAVLIRQAGRTYSLVVLCVLLPVFILSATERPWPIDTADWLIWVVPGALLSYPAAKRLSGEEISAHRRRPEDAAVRAQRIAEPAARTSHD